MNEVEIVDMYVNQKLSTYVIAEKLATYPNKIRRTLKKLGIELNDRSEAQKLAIETGRSKHPTLGIKRNQDVKNRISETVFKNWQNISEEKRLKRGKELLKLVGLAERMKHRPSELSGGEQQRIGLATALANDPPIILADEPTGELDSATGHQILELFKRLKEEYGKTIVIVTHDQRIGQIADTVMNIVDGRIVGTMSGEEFAKSISNNAITI